MIRNLPLLLFAFSLLCPISAQAQDFDHTHKRYAEVLRTHVRAGAVDYAKLKRDPSQLDAYLDDAARVTKSAYNSWSEERRLAFLLNLYNAATLKLVVQHYPLSSIRKIAAAQGGPWKLPVVRVWGNTHTLDWLEHEVIRAKPFREPRIHFALVCAAKSCPPLRDEPYLAAQLDRQLTDQGRLFFAQRDLNRFDASKRTLHLSPLFQWYQKDFVAQESDLPAYVAQFMSQTDADALARAGTKVKIKFTKYEWALNDAKTP